MSKPFTLPPHFDDWAGRADVQEQARSFISAALGPDHQKLLSDLEAPVMGVRLMNFRVINAMNALYWHFEDRLVTGPVPAGRADFNSMATEDDPAWRKAIVILAYGLGFRD